VVRYTWANTQKSTRGTATVEFAIILPILLGILFAIIEFGFLFKDQLTLQQAAREGARAAAVGKCVSDINAQVTGSATTLDPTKLTFVLEYRTYSGGWSAWTTLGDTGGTPAANNAPQGAQVRVRCTYNHLLLTGPLFARMISQPGATQKTLYAQMVMRRE
jgi:Flp pilus assembly protein TadG